MKILVTGGAGFIGSHLVDELLSEDYELVVIDNFSSGSFDNLSNSITSPKLKVIKGDLRDASVLVASLSDTQTVFHFAANPEVRIGDPNEHFENNIKATYNLLEVMRKMDVANIVFASSSTVYGDAEALPTPESYGPLKPISIYGASKLACKALISSYAYTYSFRGISLKYFQCYRPQK